MSLCLKRYLFVNIQFSENLSGIEQVLIIQNPTESPCQSMSQVSKFELDLLLCVESQERQVQQQCQPVSVDQKEESQECVNGSFGNDVGVEAVAEIDGIDIVTVASCQHTSM